MRIFLEALVTGLGLGAVYALISLGYTLILASSSVFNLAQGALTMGGVLAMLGLWQILRWPLVVDLVVIAIGGAVAGAAVFLVAVDPLMHRKSARSETTQMALITTFGISVVLVTVASTFFGYNTVSVKSYVTTNPIIVNGISIPPIYVVMLGVSILIFGAFELVLHHSVLGLRLRAAVADREGASLIGVSVVRTAALAFAAAGALAGIAGFMVAPATFASTSVGQQLALYGFAGMGIGGFGSFGGALAGGLIVGVVSSVAGVYVSPDMVYVVVYLLMVGILTIKPSGIFGRAGRFGAARLREL